MMGLIEALGYEIPTPNAAQRAMWHVSSSRAGAWLFSRSMHHVDGLVLRLSHGQRTAAGITAGVPVLTVTTTGARTGQPRSTPLLGVPFGSDIAIIGTRFGQPGTPGWYYNLCAQPRAEVAFRDRSFSATAREADEDEWQQIWAQARNIYAGYEAYASRITNRKIRIMILSAS
jgi:deazaflavin-dependent oxidoreductase (nitroreductase family)